MPENNNMKNIAVFGGSWPRPGHPAYQEAYVLGEELAKAGYVVLNGGYIGTMEAVSRGARENGGHVIGFSCDEIERWRKVQPNPWVSEVKRFETLRSRLMAMVDTCDAAVALSGGVGTLAEVSMMWNHLLTLSIPLKPLILLGPQWEIVIDHFYSHMGDYVPQNQREYIKLASDIQNTLHILKGMPAGG